MPLLHVAQVIDDVVGDLTCLKVDDSSAGDSIHYQLSSSAQHSRLFAVSGMPDCSGTILPVCKNRTAQ